MSWRRLAKSVFTLAIGLMVAVIPIAWKPHLAEAGSVDVRAASGVPVHATLESYAALFGWRGTLGYRAVDINFWFYMRNSLVAAVGSTLLTRYLALPPMDSRGSTSGQASFTFAIVSSGCFLGSARWSPCFW
jgi:ABC-type glycerol-3-phosphate transport system permease component